MLTASCQSRCTARSTVSSCPLAPHAVQVAADGTVAITVNMRVNHGGWLGFKICPTRSNPTQACFDSYRLTR